MACITVQYYPLIILKTLPQEVGTAYTDTISSTTIAISEFVDNDTLSALEVRSRAISLVR